MIEIDYTEANIDGPEAIDDGASEAHYTSTLFVATYQQGETFPIRILYEMWLDYVYYEGRALITRDGRPCLESDFYFVTMALRGKAHEQDYSKSCKDPTHGLVVWE